MNANGTSTILQQTGVPLVGQPCTLERVGIPVNAVIRCHCGGNDSIEIVLSQPDSCPSCHRMYNAVLDPATMKIGIMITIPKISQELQ